MQPTLLGPPIRSSLDPRTQQFQENRAAMLEKLEEITEERIGEFNDLVRKERVPAIVIDEE